MQLMQTQSNALLLVERARVERTSARTRGFLRVAVDAIQNAPDHQSALIRYSWSRTLPKTTIARVDI